MNAANHDDGATRSREPDNGVALVVKQLSKSFLIGKRRIQALHDVSFSVRHGVVTGLVGPDARGQDHADAARRRIAGAG